MYRLNVFTYGDSRSPMIRFAETKQEAILFRKKFAELPHVTRVTFRKIKPIVTGARVRSNNSLVQVVSQTSAYVRAVDSGKNIKNARCAIKNGEGKTSPIFEENLHETFSV